MDLTRDEQLLLTPENFPVGSAALSCKQRRWLRVEGWSEAEDGTPLASLYVWDTEDEALFRANDRSRGSFLQRVKTSGTKCYPVSLGQTDEEAEATEDEEQLFDALEELPAESDAQEEISIPDVPEEIAPEEEEEAISELFDGAEDAEEEEEKTSQADGSLYSPDTRISDLPGVSTRMKTSLFRAGIKTIGETLRYDDDDLLAIKGVGATVLAEIKDFQERFCGETHPEEDPLPPKPYEERAPKPIVEETVSDEEEQVPPATGVSATSRSVLSVSESLESRDNFIVALEGTILSLLHSVRDVLSKQSWNEEDKDRLTKLTQLAGALSLLFPKEG